MAVRLASAGNLQQPAPGRLGGVGRRLAEREDEREDELRAIVSAATSRTRRQAPASPQPSIAEVFRANGIIPRSFRIIDGIDVDDLAGTLAELDRA